MTRTLPGRRRLAVGLLTLGVALTMFGSLAPTAQAAGDDPVFGDGYDSYLNANQRGISSADVDGGECPTHSAVSGKTAWHFVLSQNTHDFASLDVAFTLDGGQIDLVGLTPKTLAEWASFDAGHHFITAPDGKHAYVYTDGPGTLRDAAAQTSPDTPGPKFQLSHVCAPGDGSDGASDGTDYGTTDDGGDYGDDGTTDDGTTDDGTTDDGTTDDGGDYGDDGTTDDGTTDDGTTDDGTTDDGTTDDGTTDDGTTDDGTTDDGTTDDGTTDDGTTDDGTTDDGTTDDGTTDDGTTDDGTTDDGTTDDGTTDDGTTDDGTTDDGTTDDVIADDGTVDDPTTDDGGTTTAGQTPTQVAGNVVLPTTGAEDRSLMILGGALIAAGLASLVMGREIRNRP